MHVVGRRLGDLEEKLDGIERQLGAGNPPAELTARSHDTGIDTDTEKRDEA